MSQRMIMTEHGEIEVPGTLYKYRSLSGEQRDFTKHIILERELWWSPASLLNDPLDCNPVARLTGGRLANELAMRRTLRTAFPAMPKFEVKRVAAWRAGRPSVEFETAMGRMIEEARATIGVCSLSSDPASPKLWSDYADLGRGICLRFDDTVGKGSSFLSTEPHFGLAMKVVYDDNRPQISVYRDNLGFDKLKKYLLTKTRQWEYEAEWRLVRQGFTGNRAFPAQCLTGIIFGPDIDPNDLSDVIDWTKRRSTLVELFQAKNKSTRVEISVYRHS